MYPNSRFVGAVLYPFDFLFLLQVFHCWVAPPRDPLSSSTMTSRLQVHLSAKNLRNMSGFRGVSDPFAVVTVRGDDVNNRPRVVGQTDV